MTDIFGGLTGDGVSMLAAARFVPTVGVEVTTVPGGVAVMNAGAPRRLMKVGWVALERAGSDTGWPTSVFADQARWISFEREQMSYGSPGVFADRVRYHLEPGVVASLYVNESAAAAAVSSSAAPWDRNPSSFLQQAGASPTGPATSTLWTYTVPTGRKLLVSHASLQLVRSAVASAPSFVLLGLRRNNDKIEILESYSNVLGYHDRAQIAPGDLVLLAGETLSAVLQNGDTGGVWEAWAFATGLTFDA